MSTPQTGEIWRSKTEDIEVQILDQRTEAAVRFKYIKAPWGTGIEGAPAVASLKSFLLRYELVDVFEAQHPAVKVGETWWHRQMPHYHVAVLSVFNGIVTGQFTDQRHSDVDDSYVAIPVERFIGQYTNTASHPTADDYQDWPARAHFSVVTSDGTPPSVRFVGWDMPGVRLHPDEAVVGVPIDWSKATWEVEPS